MAIAQSERLLDVRRVVQDAHLPPQRLARQPPREVLVVFFFLLLLPSSSSSSLPHFE